MPTTHKLSPTLHDPSLLEEATSIERLRREISESTSKGTSVSREKLAEFAQKQKAYLQRKISSAKQPKPEAIVPPSHSQEPHAQEPTPAKTSSPRETSPSRISTKNTARSASFRITLWLLLLATIALGTWLFS